jgi:uncharacterized protein
MNDGLIEKIKEESKKYFENARPTHDWTHVERVMKLSERIGRSENADLLTIRLAVLLHDTERIREDKYNGKVCHARESVETARKILEKYNLKEELIKNVCHCIETHRFRNGNEPKTKEAKVLYDADKLDSVGAIGIARAYSFSGENNQKLYSAFEDCEPRTGYESNYTPVKEFYSKLLKVKKKMFTEEGRKIAEERHKFMIEFFNRLKMELEGGV